MRVLSLAEIRKDYHNYLLRVYKDWNKAGTKTDTASQRVSDTFYLWNNGNKIDYWEYLAGKKSIAEAHNIIKTLLAKNNAPLERQNGYCDMLDEFKYYFDVVWGGITNVIDEEHIEVCGVESAAESKKYRYIKADDNISFAYNYEALNACFGASMFAPYQQPIWDSKDGCRVWFPHLAKIEGGKYLPGSRAVNWKNIFENNGKIIIQFLYPGEKVDDNGREPDLRNDAVPMHTFMKMGEKDYRYCGTFLTDYYASTPRRKIARRIKDSIDLSIWASGYDTDYFDTSVIGKDVYKDYYIKKNFKKQKELIELFLKNEASFAEDEKAFESVKKDFIDGFGLAVLGRMNSEQFASEYIMQLSIVLNKLFDVSYSVEQLREKLSTLSDFGTNLISLLNDSETSLNDRIRRCPWGITLAAQIFTLYSEKSEEILFTLDEKEIERIYFALGKEIDESTDLVEKQSWLYFWRHCDDVLLSWTGYKYSQFLRYMSNLRKKDIRYISSSRPEIEKRIKSETKQQEEEFQQEDFTDVPENFTYNSTPRPREINTNSKPSQGAMVPRHADRKINALIKAKYSCEIDCNHPTFMRRNSDKKYTETHHLIPLEYSAQFKYTLDTEENIVSLCSNCHNQIHYGQGAENLIKQLFDERKEALKAAGLGITENGISLDLVQLLHMYGIDP